MSIGVEKATAEMIVERLNEEGVLHLGYGDADVDQIVYAFAKAFGTTKIRPQDRYAAARLAKVHGSQAITQIITLLESAGDMQYVPVVNSVSELETKLQSVLHFLRKTHTDNEVIPV